MRGLEAVEGQLYDVRDQCLEAAMDDHVTKPKPIRVERLVEARDDAPVREDR